MGVMNKLRNLLLIIFLLFVLGIPCQSASAKSIGVIMTGDIPYYQEIHKAFLDSLNQQDLEIVLQKPMPDPMSWTNAAKKLKTIGVSVIVAYGVPATLTTMKVTSKIPIVFAGVYDPEALRLTGKNATGISSTVSVDMALKNLSGISGMKKLGVILNKSEKDTILQTKKIKKGEASYGYKSVLFSIKSKVNKSKITGVDALLLTTCSTGMLNIKDIIDIARSSKIPTAALIGGGENQGVVLTISADPDEQGKELAGMVNKVLGGTKPSEIPFKKPTKVEMIINLKEANSLGINIPADIKSLATKVIE
jgi:putative ABC transport system substrate-binding protein